MNSLTLNEILNYDEIHQNDHQNDDIDVTEFIISDMQNMSLIETFELVNDLFDNNLDIYTAYNETKNRYLLDPTEYNTDTPPIPYKYNILRVINVPNIYCDGNNFDDEDFIYNLFKLSNHLSYLVQNDNTVPEIDISIINFSETTLSPENVYYKILYIYQFVHYFHTSLSEIYLKKRILHLPQEFLLWVDNIISIIRNTIDISDMNTSLCVYKNETHDNLQNINKYFKDMVYGMNLCICHLKMILNHHRNRDIHFWNMEEKYIEKFFRILNNLCIIVIYMKHGI